MITLSYHLDPKYYTKESFQLNSSTYGRLDVASDFETKVEVLAFRTAQSCNNLFRMPMEEGAKYQIQKKQWEESCYKVQFTLEGTTFYQKQKQRLTYICGFFIKKNLKNTPLEQANNFHFAIPFPDQTKIHGQIPLSSRLIFIVNDPTLLKSHQNVERTTRIKMVPFTNFKKTKRRPIRLKQVTFTRSKSPLSSDQDSSPLPSPNQLGVPPLVPYLIPEHLVYAPLTSPSNAPPSPIPFPETILNPPTTSVKLKTSRVLKRLSEQKGFQPYSNTQLPDLIPLNSSPPTSSQETPVDEPVKGEKLSKKRKAALAGEVKRRKFLEEGLELDKMLKSTTLPCAPRLNPQTTQVLSAAASKPATPTIESRKRKATTPSQEEQKKKRIKEKSREEKPAEKAPQPTISSFLPAWYRQATS